MRHLVTHHRAIYRYSCTADGDTNADRHSRTTYGDTNADRHSRTADCHTYPTDSNTPATH
jgi:hypothetical protein